MKNKSDSSYEIFTELCQKSTECYIVHHLVVACMSDNTSSCEHFISPLYEIKYIIKTWKLINFHIHKF